MSSCHSLLFIVFVSLPEMLFSQTDSIIYFDHFWEETAFENAAYYRVVKNDGRLFHAKDYYLSGNLQMEGGYTSLEPEIQHGYFTWYFDNGQKFAEGNYDHGQRDGLWTFWYPDGLRKQEISFTGGRTGEAVIRWESKRLKVSRHIIQKALDQSKAEKALTLLNSAIEANPFSAEAFYERAGIKLKAGDWEGGCEDLFQSRKLWYEDMIELSRQIEEWCDGRHGKKPEQRH